MTAANYAQAITNQRISDNLVNLISGIGRPGTAKTPASQILNPQPLTDSDVEAIYTGEGFGKKVVDVYADTMTRDWITVKGDPEDALIKYLAAIKTKKSMNHAIKWSRLYGTAVIVMLIDDGGQLEDPVNLKAINTIEELRVVEKPQLSIESGTDLYDDPSKPNFGTVKVYTVTPAQTIGTILGTNTDDYRVHESRILRFDGEVLPSRLLVQNDYFGVSVYVALFEYLTNLATGYKMSAEILHEYVISVFSFKNLAQTLARPGGEELIKQRIEIMNYSKSVINGIALDADGEAYQKITTSLSGIPDLIDRFALALAGASGIPYVLLLGDSPSGLNATGDSELRSWYDSVANEQHETMTDPLTKLLTYVLASRDNPLKGKTIADLEVIYNPLWQIDEPTLIDMRNKQADTDQKYLEDGVATNTEIRQSRFSGDAYSFETTVDPDLTVTVPPEPPPSGNNTDA